MTGVETLIAERSASATAVIPDIAHYLLNAGGKRIRPLITVAAARLCGYEGQGHLALAAAVEFIHTATLLHDDVVDDSALRRGKAPANQVWGNAQSVLVGDFLFARAFMLMVDAGSMRALHVLSRAAAVIAEGEVRQLAAARQIATTRDQYMDIIAAKTAALFAAAAQVSPILAGASPRVEAGLEIYGRELGLAFQLVDDALDYGGVAEALGKNTGDDFREGKITLPVALAMEAGGEAERSFWARTMGEGVQGPEDFDEAVARLKRHGALDATLEQARAHAARAVEALDAAPDNVWSQSLAALAEFVVERAY
ncbi:polyprenyl synthetase family protein [Alkalicaulis satelles]|uniref:Octaprenyl diphosphate synthase n=2 Tax=Alkalicaulis satelles TaxID=2609175 RepID=A0A5M6ZF92_9PROT|nr:polyprenyl synthetase family protein [Alkalicaulis satelles]